MTTITFVFLLHTFQNVSLVKPSLLPRRSNLNSYGLFSVEYLSSLLSIHEAISVACTSLITFENGSVVRIGNFCVKIMRGGRIFEDTDLFGEINRIFTSFQRAFSRICLYGCTYS
ncbi:hypothetical protein C2G38_2111084 [Gigaspora rosea]|uniref:Uncharacterized protein n=1 Tax=Gigaspora rosea TaxID=44941 RepID=A0A397UDR6_9GLOM|nr:hypothetical protein C2G38_2111084 [Gigaspora rosea]